MHKSMGPNKMHLRVLREMVDKVAKPVYIDFEKLCQSSEASRDWKSENIK